jgi:hypothetical protein
MAINIPNGRNIYQMAIEYSSFFHSKALKTFTQIWHFGFITYHHHVRVVIWAIKSFPDLGGSDECILWLSFAQQKASFSPNHGEFTQTFSHNPPSCWR